MLGVIHEADLLAFSGIGAFAATAMLAVFAGFQMKASQAQVTTMRDTAEAQIAALNKTAEKELEAVRDQIEASIAQNDAVREAARAQLQPIVFAHGWGSAQSGSDVPPGMVRLWYYLRNEGVGPALDVEHGISVAGIEHTIDDLGRRFRTLSAHESAPPGYPGGVSAVLPQPLSIHLAGSDGGQDRVYWTRFSNVFGERFEVKNFSDGSRAAEFRRLSEA